MAQTNGNIHPSAPSTRHRVTGRSGSCQFHDSVHSSNLLLSCLFVFLDMTLHQHVDGAGKVDGSIVVALPIDRWSASEEENAFEGGGLTFWDGPKQQEIQYDTRSGDLALIDR